MPSYARIASLGSSFAAGPGIEPVVDAGAMRSGRNYPHLLAEALGASLTDLTVSGATTASILSEPQLLPFGGTVPPQLDGLPADADLVTVTAGGNDLQYIGSMLFTALRRVVPGNPMLQTMAAGFPQGIPDPGDAEISAAADGLASIVAAVREKAPEARVVLVDYLTIVGPDALAMGAEPFTGDELYSFARIGVAVEQAFVRAAEWTGADLVRASALSVAHGLSTVEPWVAPFSPTLSGIPGSFHPNGNGMRAVAEAVAAHLA